MSKELISYKPPPSNRLHPTVYAAMAGVALWFAIAVWGFASDGYTAWLLTVVSGFVFIVVALQFVLSRVGTKDPTSHPSAESQAARQSENFKEWTSGEFETWQDRVKGSNAAVEILLPIAALAVGMTAFAIVFLSVSGTL
jgi:hypothetical protein